MNNIIKNTIGLSAVFALICIGLFFLQLRKTSVQVSSTTAQLSESVVSMQHDVTDLKQPQILPVGMGLKITFMSIVPSEFGTN